MLCRLAHAAPEADFASSLDLVLSEFEMRKIDGKQTLVHPEFEAVLAENLENAIKRSMRGSVVRRSARKGLSGTSPASTEASPLFGYLGPFVTSKTRLRSALGPSPMTESKLNLTIGSQRQDRPAYTTPA